MRCEHVCIFILQGVENVQVPTQTEPQTNQQNISPKQAVKDQSYKLPVSDKQSYFSSPHPHPSVDQMKQQQMDTMSRPPQGTVLPPLSSSMMKKDMKVESTKIIYISGPLYQHRDDSDHSTSTLTKISAPSKQEQKNTKQQPERPVTTLPPLTTFKDQSAKFQRSK